MGDYPSSGSEGTQHWPDITRQEIKIIQLLAQGMTNRQISCHLDITVQTVKNHTSSIYKKLGAANHIQAVIIAKEMGIVLF